MREIKFRIFSGNGFDCSGGTPSMLANFFAMTAIYHTRDGYPYEQFTGLHDVNGRDIYEGDIVYYEGGNYFVEYNSSMGCYQLRSSFNRNKHTTIAPIPNDAKVVDNIHENPELLA